MDNEEIRRWHKANVSVSLWRCDSQEIRMSVENHCGICSILTTTQPDKVTHYNSTDFNQSLR